MKYRYSESEREDILTDPWLTDREREVFVYFYMRGWKIEDIAAEMDVSRTTVQSVLHDIRKRHPPNELNMS